MEYNRYFFIELLNEQNIDPGLVWWIDFLIISSLLLGISFLLAVASKLVVNIFLKKLSSGQTHLDDYLLSSEFPLFLQDSLLFSIVCCAIWIVDSPYATSIVLTSLNVYGVIVTIWIFRSILQTLRAFLLT